MPDNLRCLVRLHPRGPLSLEEGNLPWRDLSVAADLLDMAEIQSMLLVAEILPNRATQTLSHWESVYGITRIGNTIAKRRDAIIAARRLLPDFKPATVEDIVETVSGLALTVLEPGGFRCDDAASVCDDSADLLDGAFVFVLDASALEARAESPDLDAADEMIGAIKPAHTVGFIRFDDFRCNDLYSRCDRDLLGV